MSYAMTEMCDICGAVIPQEKKNFLGETIAVSTRYQSNIIRLDLLPVSLCKECGAQVDIEMLELKQKMLLEAAASGKSK